jgi:hypothetical protein
VLISIRSRHPVSGALVVLCDTASLDSRLILPVAVTVTSGSTKQAMWLYDQSMFPSQPDEPALGSGELAVSHAVAQRVFRQAPGSPFEATLDLPVRRRLTVALARVDDLPSGDSIQMSVQDAQLLGVEGVSALVTTRKGTLASAKVQVRDHVHPGSVKIPMVLRTMLSIQRSDDVMVSLSRPVLREVPGPRRISKLTRRADRLLEKLLRRIFRAPAAAMLVTQMPPGDDDTVDIARIDAHVLAGLGLQAGEQALLSWQGAVSAVRLLVALPRDGTDRVLEVQGVDRRVDFSDGVPATLVIQVSAAVRRDLGLPVGAVVSVRRRVRTSAQSKLNQLTIPLLGLLLAAAAIKDVPWWAIFAGAGLTSILGLANLRVPRPPRGLY